MLIVFSPIFLNDTKINFIYHFVALFKQVIIVLKISYEITLKCKQRNLQFDIENQTILTMVLQPKFDVSVKFLVCS